MRVARLVHRVKQQTATIQENSLYLLSISKGQRSISVVSFIHLAQGVVGLDRKFNGV